PRRGGQKRLPPTCGWTSGPGPLARPADPPPPRPRPGPGSPTNATRAARSSSVNRWPGGWWVAGVVGGEAVQPGLDGVGDGVDVAGPEDGRVARREDAG